MVTALSLTTDQDRRSSKVNKNADYDSVGLSSNPCQLVIVGPRNANHFH